MEIRPYTPADADALADVYRRSVLGLGPRDYTPRQVAAWMVLAPTPERLRERYGDGRIVLMAVAADGRAHPPPRRGERSRPAAAHPQGIPRGETPRLRHRGGRHPQLGHGEGPARARSVRAAHRPPGRRRPAPWSREEPDAV